MNRREGDTYRQTQRKEVLPMNFKDFQKLTPEEQEAYWAKAQAAAQEKAVKRTTT